jgi:hypothetical protein
MSATVPPTPPASLVTALASALASARGTVVSAPDAAALTQGLSVSAQVVSSGSGQILLSSSLGQITVQSNAALPEGTSVLLQVQSVGETVRVSLSFQQYPAAPQGSGSGAGTAQGAQVARAGAAPVAQAAPVVTQLTEGSVLQATVTRAAAPEAVPGAAPGAAPGALPSIAPSATPGAVASTQPAPPAQQAAVPAAAAAPGAPQAASPGAVATPGALPVGSSVTVRVLAVAPPGGALPATSAVTAAPGAQVITATVSGHQAGGAAVVTGNAAELTLPDTHPLPTGSRLLLEVVNLQPPAAGQDGAPLSFLGGGRWEALSETLTLLQQLDPALARHVVETAIPNPGPRMGATMLFVLSAIFSGDVRRFLGAEAVRQLGRATESARDRVGKEFTQLQRPATDAAGQDWRVFFIPILTEEGLQQIRFMLRRNEEEGGTADGDTGTRFMIEVTMSRLGPMQFDGLTRKKHLDLVIRTQHALPDKMGDEIRSIFGNTITALGFTGTIALRVVPRFDVAPVDQAADNHKDLVV